MNTYNGTISESRIKAILSFEKKIKSGGKQNERRKNES
jgi:hypothetical protein